MQALGGQVPDVSGNGLPPGPAGHPGHRGRKGDPLYGIRTILRLGSRTDEKPEERIAADFAVDPGHDEVVTAWQAIHQIRCAYTTD